MEIQSLSVLVPTNGCVNKCKFCVSRMHENCYKNVFDFEEDRSGFIITPFDDAKLQLYKRLKFSRDNNCNTAMLTGTGEALQNKKFLELFAQTNKSLPNPFIWIELQTSGVMLTDENLSFLKRTVEVDTISLSLSDIFDDEVNAEICGMSEKLKVKIEVVCRAIKRHGFNLRLSLNMSNIYDKIAPGMILRRAKDLGADQVTFRKLYSSGEESDIDKWVNNNKMDAKKFGNIKTFIKSFGKELEILPFGARKYSYDGMGIVVDDDCMSEEVRDVYKYLILRENARLYSRWDDHGSLIF